MPNPSGQILRRERGPGNINVHCSAEHEQDWQPYPVDPYSCFMCDHTIKTCKNSGPTSVLGIGCFDYWGASLCLGDSVKKHHWYHINGAAVSKSHKHA